ncbi:hypothetical protein PFISCL1PPCAC_14233 [Pristionchus fissidentatus]|uniref:Uncharacterized protein n=1 Tax=Pristionchus fissidentatus TaxID=1538716 RepID=A0AAV5VTD2_9BILA|nr:hypothetical protein PFISCL1PPCAC_14233 [Pristionchus fissidentatus]
MADLTPEKIQKARALLKANPSILDDSIAKLSADAQVHAKKMRDLFLSDGADAAKMKAAADETRAKCSASVIAELEAHKKIVSEKIGAAI